MSGIVRIEKDDGSELWRLFMRHAKQLELLLGPDFYQTLVGLKDAIPLDALEDALTSGNVDLVAQGILANPTITASVRDAMQYAVGAAGIFTANDVLPATFAVRFDRYNPRAVEVIQTESANLVREVTDDVRLLIQAVGAKGLRNGWNPRTTAMEIRDNLGLTVSQWNAVSNYRNLLESNDRDALSRQLRDRRFDSSLRSAIGSGQSLSAEKIDRMVARYTAKYLKARAETVTRTEAIRALYQGQRLAWQQAFDEGKANPYAARRFWYPADDERTCPICMGIPDQNPDGVGFDEPFQSDAGPIDGPPDPHPRCRCAVFVTFDQ